MVWEVGKETVEGDRNLIDRALTCFLLTRYLRLLLSHNFKQKSLKMNNLLVLQNFTIARKSGNGLLSMLKNVSAFSCNRQDFIYRKRTTNALTINSLVIKNFKLY